jgi:hypothetical protein
VLAVLLWASAAAWATAAGSLRVTDVLLSTGVARLSLVAAANETQCRQRLPALTGPEGYEPAPTGVNVPTRATCLAWRAFSDAKCVPLPHPSLSV